MIAEVVTSSVLGALRSDPPPAAARSVGEPDTAAVADALAALGSELARRMGAAADLPGARLLIEREDLCTRAHTRLPGRSLRGSTRIDRCADGWLAVNLARTADRESLPALTLGAVTEDETGWEAWSAAQAGKAVIARARLLGLAVGFLPDATPAAADSAPFLVRHRGALRRRSSATLTVVDATRLWAGPLAGALLATTGARVVRLVDPRRAAPTEPQDAAFETRLQSGKTVRHVDFTDRDDLADAFAEADVVLTSTRAAALERMPPVPADRLHVALTAHGMGTMADRVGFGDDCAFEAGLVDWHDGRPEFHGDAVADPLTGLLAAVATIGAVGSGIAGRLELDLARTARWTAIVGADA